MVKKAVNDFIVLENTALNATNYYIRLKSPVLLPEISPGQFVNVEIKHTDEVFLRRPFSVFEVSQGENTISLLVKVLGKGSKTLSEAKAGDTISLVYPLGKGFTKPQRTDRILLIGGGSGVAPILFLSKWSGLPKGNIHILIGARSNTDHIDTRNYSGLGEISLTTEDGSCGFRGLVTEHPLFTDEINTFNKIYTCGPLPMMKAIAKAAARENIFCEVSLENLMACGFGVCLCCIEPTTKGNLCVCTDGPVFNINILKW